VLIRVKGSKLKIKKCDGSAPSTIFSLSWLHITGSKKLISFIYAVNCASHSLETAKMFPWPSTLETAFKTVLKRKSWAGFYWEICSYGPQQGTMVTSVLIPGCLVVFKDSISVSESLWYVCTVYHLLIILSCVSVDQRQTLKW